MEALIIGLIIVFSALGYMTYELNKFDSDTKHNTHD